MTNIRALFDQARRAPGSQAGNALAVVQGNGKYGQRSWFGFDADKRPTAVFETNEALGSPYGISGAVTVEPKKVQDQVGGGNNEELALVLTCLDPSLETAFISFLEDIIERIADDSAVIASVANAANQLRRLLSLQKSALGEEAALGLFGELSFLHRLAEVFGPQAVDMWTGPANKQHDFTTTWACTEVKTSAFQNRSEITVHGLKQLAPLADLPLTLAVADVEKGTGNTVDELIDELAAFGITHGMLFPLLEKAGFAYGMKGADSLRFSLQRWRFWEISADSPVLSYVHLDDATVNAIGNVRYSLNLSSLGEPSEDFNGIPILKGNA